MSNIQEIKYYLKPDKSILALSNRGLFIYDYHDDIWLNTRGMPINTDLCDAKQISLEEVEKRKLHNILVSQKYEDSIYLNRIGIRNSMTANLSFNDKTHDNAEDLYVNSIPIIDQLIKGRVLEISRPVTFFVGENGTGKSTLLEAISIGFGLNAEGGDKDFTFETRRDYSDLFKLIQIGRRKNPKDGFFLRAESFYNLATAIDDNIVLGHFGDKSLHKQSHGESFMALIKNRFRENGLYILDEPEAALSPQRVIELMKEINRLVNMGSQFVIATHSPILITFPEAQIFELTNTGVYEKKYSNLDSFCFTRDFLLNPEYYLRKENL